MRGSPWSSGGHAEQVSRKRALDYVFGYTCANGVSAERLAEEEGGSQWIAAENPLIPFCPLGPCLE